ncbi:MAG: hypothetical protein PHC64_03895 [Candidatus Gastranaerophilales bacterium]|nr:hypothetical protein [Candidatus Gastranaerophilales bacterium]
MNRIILFLIMVTATLPVMADYTVETYQPLYPAQIEQQNYSTSQPYQQPYFPYNQGYYNPYQAQLQTPYVSPYQCRAPYGYGGNLLNPLILSSGSSTGSSQVVQSIGRTLLYSLFRGY